MIVSHSTMVYDLLFHFSVNSTSSILSRKKKFSIFVDIRGSDLPSEPQTSNFNINKKIDLALSVKKIIEI